MTLSQRDRDTLERLEEELWREDTRFEAPTIWVRDTRGGRATKLTVIGVLDPRATFGI